jgi:type I restriction enzyme, S subunit
MGSEWPRVTLGDLAASSPNALVGGPFGSNLLARDRASCGVPVIQGANMGSGRWLGGDLVFVSDEKADSLAANIARCGDIVFTQRGTVGQVALVPDTFPRWVVSQSQMKLTPDPAVADVKYLYYYFSSPEQVERMRSRSIQTGVPHTNLGILRDSTVALPPLDEQRRIASILGALDDKIELNRRMSRTLGEVIRAIFGLLISERDWPVGSLYDLCDVVYGVPFKSDRFNTNGEGKGVIRIRDIATNAPGMFTDEVLPRATIIRAGDIVVGMDGEFLVEHWMGEDALLNQRVGHLRPKSGVPRSFLSHVARGPVRFFETAKTGTTVVHLGKGDIDTIGIPVPDRDALSEFGRLTEPMLDRRVVAARETRALAATRDRLLPALLEQGVDGIRS